MHDTPFHRVGSPRDYDGTLLEVEQIVAAFSPSHDLNPLRHAATLVRQLFDGELPGYQTLQTPYHDRCHTLEVFLCAARLLDGLDRAGHGVDADGIDAVLIGALLHDVGYVKTDAEGAGSGAQYTAQHVERGVRFAERNCGFLPAAKRAMVINAIRATDHRRDPAELDFASETDRRAALVLATADIVGQMASREYLERLLFLYFEFREAGFEGFADAHDLLEKTAEFYRVTRRRLETQLGGLVDFLTLHFTRAAGEARNFYAESIDRNIAYLDRILVEDREHRLDRLKRGGIVEQALKMSGA